MNLISPNMMNALSKPIANIQAACVPDRVIAASPSSATTSISVMMIDGHMPAAVGQADRGGHRGLGRDQPGHQLHQRVMVGRSRPSWPLLRAAGSGELGTLRSPLTSMTCQR